MARKRPIAMPGRKTGRVRVAAQAGLAQLMNEFAHETQTVFQAEVFYAEVQRTLAGRSVTKYRPYVCTDLQGILNGVVCFVNSTGVTGFGQYKHDAGFGEHVAKSKASMLLTQEFLQLGFQAGSVMRTQISQYIAAVKQRNVLEAVANLEPEIPAGVEIGATSNFKLLMPASACAQDVYFKAFHAAWRVFVGCFDDFNFGHIVVLFPCDGGISVAQIPGDNIINTCQCNKFVLQNGGGASQAGGS